MKGSWRIGRVAGIDLYVHFTFLLLPLGVALQYWSLSRSWTQVIAGVTFILALFACVVLHELGHALAARRYGIRTRDITLLPIGGVARLERMPENPLHELVVALAGPLVNVAIALALALPAGIGQLFSSLTGIEPVGQGFLVSLMRLNLVLALFNMIPAFPMDGGRVLRALLARKIDYVKATQIAATVGQAAALAFFFFGFMAPAPMLILIAVFIYLGAESEAAAVQTRRLFHGIPVRQAMQSNFITLDADASLGDAVRALLSGSQQDFPVVEQSRVIGMLYRRDLLEALRELGEEARVSRIVRRDLTPIEVGDMLDVVVEQMTADSLPALPVMWQGQLVGLLTLENIGEFVAIQSARAKQRDRIESARPWFG